MSEVTAEAKVRKVFTSYMDGRVLSAEEAIKKEPVQVLALDNDVLPLAEVGYSIGLTINLGNYQSARVDVSVKLPTPVEDLQSAYKAAKVLAMGWLHEEEMSINGLKTKAQEPSADF